jgi:hypothetical protein
MNLRGRPQRLNLPTQSSDHLPLLSTVAIAPLVRDGELCSGRTSDA